MLEDMAISRHERNRSSGRLLERNMSRGKSDPKVRRHYHPVEKGAIIHETRVCVIVYGRCVPLTSDGATKHEMEYCDIERPRGCKETLVLCTARKLESISRQGNGYRQRWLQ